MSLANSEGTTLPISLAAPTTDVINAPHPMALSIMVYISGFAGEKLESTATNGK